MRIGKRCVSLSFFFISLFNTDNLKSAFNSIKVISFYFEKKTLFLHPKSLNSILI